MNPLKEWTNGTPENNYQDGTQLDAADFESWSKELVAVLASAGIAPEADKFDQLLTAIRQLAWGGQIKPTTLAGYGITDALPVRTPLGSGVNLNNIIETGLYLQGSTADATSGSNYPVPAGGWLMVYSPAAGANGAVVQQYHSVYGSRVFVRSRDGGIWSAWRELAGSEHGKTVITASAAFVVPANVRRVCVTLAAGGGGGAGAISGAVYAPGGGGAGEVKYREWLDVTPGQSITVTIGAGGAGGSGSAAGGSYANSNGAAGGASSFGSLLTAAGGGGGRCQSGEASGGPAGSGPYAADGADGPSVSASPLGAAGGGNILAAAMYGDYNSGGVAKGYGAGGAGGRTGTGYWQNGAAGGSGVCIVEW